MKEELLKRLVEAADLILTWAKTGAGEAPQVAREIVTWGIVSNSAIALLLLALAALTLTMGRRAWRDEWDGDRAIGALLHIASVIAFAVSCVVGLDAAKAWIVPRLYVLDQIRSWIIR